MITGILPLSPEYSHDRAQHAMANVSGISPNDTLPERFDAAEHARSPGITTVPGVDPPLAGQSTSFALPCARMLGNTKLLETEIDDLFRM